MITCNAYEDIERDECSKNNKSFNYKGAVSLL